MTRSFPLTIFFVLFGIATCLGQNSKKYGFHLTGKDKRKSISFDLVNNLISIPASLMSSPPFGFIVDSGAGSVILTDKRIADLLNLDFSRSIYLPSIGLVDSLLAYVTINTEISLNNGIVGGNLQMLVLEEDYLNLREHLGKDIYGIIGYPLFENFVVEINYVRRLLTFHNPQTFKVPRKSQKLPLIFRNDKPFVRTIIGVEGEKRTVELMIDTGAGHTLLLHENSIGKSLMPSTSVRTLVGQGTGGEIPGKIARVSHFSIGSYILKDVLVSIPDQEAYYDAVIGSSKSGTIGGGLLNRFNIILDYQNNSLYIKKNKNFTRPFKYDRSGLLVIVKGIDKKRWIVKAVDEGTPSFEASIRIGDEILSANDLDPNNIGLDGLNSLLRKREGKSIKLKIKRGNNKIRKNFKLRPRI